jgi:hypothetical protein
MFHIDLKLCGKLIFQLITRFDNQMIWLPRCTSLVTYLPVLAAIHPQPRHNFACLWHKIAAFVHIFANRFPSFRHYGHFFWTLISGNHATLSNRLFTFSLDFVRFSDTHAVFQETCPPAQQPRLYVGQSLRFTQHFLRTPFPLICHRRPPPTGDNQPKLPPQYPSILSTKPSPTAAFSRLSCAFPLWLRVLLPLCYAFLLSFTHYLLTCPCESCSSNSYSLPFFKCLQSDKLVTKVQSFKGLQHVKA